MSVTQIPLYAVHDFELRGDIAGRDPFAVEVSAVFRHEGGKKIELPGFFDGDRWIVRFSPTLRGAWAGRTMSDHSGLDGVEFSVSCTANENPNVHGFLGIDPQAPQRFAWSDGTPLVYLGFECDWLFSYHQADRDRCDAHVDRIAASGFSAIVTNLYAHTGFSLQDNDDARPAPPEFIFGPPKRFPFGGTNEAPDHSRFNAAFFRDFDALMRGLHRRGLLVHLMLQVQNKHVNWPPRRSAEDDRFWRYAVARYQAFGNLIWDVGKESKNLLRETGSHDYVLERMAIIRSADGYGHPVTVHDVQMRDAAALSEPDRVADVVTDQVHLRDADAYNREAIRRLRNGGKPYVNVEYGYEAGVEDLKTYGVKNTAEEMLVWTWSILLAGAYPCYYYANTSWDLIKFEPEPASWPRYRELRRFVEGLPLNRMTADNEYVARGFCLAATGEAYLAFLPEGGDLTIDLSAVEEGSNVTAEWLAVLTGEKRKVDVTKGQHWSGFVTRSACPFENADQPCAIALTSSRS